MDLAFNSEGGNCSSNVALLPMNSAKDENGKENAKTEIMKEKKSNPSNGLVNELKSE